MGVGEVARFRCRQARVIVGNQSSAEYGNQRREHLLSAGKRLPDRRSIWDSERLDMPPEPTNGAPVRVGLARPLFWSANEMEGNGKATAHRRVGWKAENTSLKGLVCFSVQCGHSALT
jgi:hypothetical protein